MFDQVNGMRHQVFATATPHGGGSIQFPEVQHRCHARVEDRIRTGKTTGFGRFPSRQFAINQAWLELALTGIDLLAWTQTLLLDGALATAEPKKLRYRLLHVAAKLSRTARTTLVGNRVVAAKPAKLPHLPGVNASPLPDLHHGMESRPESRDRWQLPCRLRHMVQAASSRKEGTSMPWIRRAAVAASTAVLTLSGLVAAGTAPASAEPGSFDLINKKDGSRLALVDNNTVAEGAFANSLRDPGWKYSTEEWTSQVVSDRRHDDTYNRVLRNVAANKCLQPLTDSPTRGMRVVVKTCNGSELQKWNLQHETVSGTNSRWQIWRPVVNKRLALTLDKYGNGSWNTLYLDTSYPSSDRLWVLRPNDQPWRY